MKPAALVLRTSGINCDVETAYAFDLAGARPEIVHLNRILEAPALLKRYQMLAIPGGFSYGDDVAAGRIFANQLQHHLADDLRAFVAAGKPIIGICNGFQVLVKTRLLPGLGGLRAKQQYTLGHNDRGRFEARWVALATCPGPCVWTAGLQRLSLPVAHGEGKFMAADDQARQILWEQRLVSLLYVCDDGSPAQGRFPANPNGSTDDIAGICDPTGLVFGLMPHPERYIDRTQHYSWTRFTCDMDEGQGLAIFRNAVRHVAGMGVGV